MFLGFAALLLLATALLALPSVQRFVAQKAVAALNQSYHTNISVEQVRYRWPNHLTLTNVYSPDHKGDTLFFLEQVAVRFGTYSRAENFLRLETLEIENMKLHMQFYPGDTLFNMAYFIQLFEEPRAPGRPPFVMEVGSYALKNISYKKFRHGCDAGCTQIFLSDAELIGTDFRLEGINISANIHQMAYKDRDRFDLKKFYGQAKWTPELVEVDTVYFLTERSEVAFSGVMTTDSMRAYSDFLNLVDITGRIHQATISSKEFQQWIPEFPNFDDFKIQGAVTGTVNDFKATEVEAFVGATKFTGQVQLSQCTDPEKLFLRAQVNQLWSNAIDVNRYVFQFLDAPPFKEYENFENFQLYGNYVGTINDFDVDGAITGDFGKLIADVKLKNFRTLQNLDYEGRLQFEAFHLGKIVGEPLLGLVDGGGIVKGSGIKRNNLRALIDFRLQSIGIERYNYKNFAVNGFVADRLFDGKIVVKDPNFQMNFEGKAGFESEDVTLDFDADLLHANLFAMGYVKDSIAVLTGKANFSFTYEKDRDWLGTITLKSPTYQNSKESFSFQNIYIKSEISGLKKRFQIESDLLDATVNGQFELAGIWPTMQYIAQSVYPHYQSGAALPDFVANLNLVVKNARLLFDLWVPELYLAPQSTLALQFDSRSKLAVLDYRSPKSKFSKHEFADLILQMDGNLERLYGKHFVGQYKFGKIDIDSLEVFTRQDGPRQFYEFGSIAQSPGHPDFNLSGMVAFLDQNITQASFEQSNFEIRGYKFEIAAGNKIQISKGRVEVDALRLSQNKGSLAFDGVISENSFEVLRVSMQEMTVGIFNDLLAIPQLQFEGVFDGELIGSDFFNAPKFAADLGIELLEINNQWIGDLAVAANWDVAENQIFLNGHNVRSGRKNLVFNGHIKPGKTSTMFLEANIDRFPVNFLDPIFEGILGNIQGLANGTFVMEGPIMKPKWEGKFDVQQLALSVPYLNTRYELEGSHQLLFTDQIIQFDDFMMQDVAQRTKGTVTGLIAHNRLQDFLLNIRVEADNLLALRTDANSGNYFYGTAFAKGVVDITGPTDNVTIRMDATSMPNTKIHIPLNNPTEISQQRFIFFVSTASQNTIENEAFEAIEGLRLDLTFNMTPEAEVELQLDPDAGGTIRGRGTGRLRLEMDESGELEMLGNYQIESGAYQFMLQRLVNKPFKVMPGSTITWNGDPFNALLDLRASYSTRTSLQGVVTSPAYTGTRVNVDLFLLLNGPLLNSDIGFQIKLPQSDPSFQEELNSRFNDPDKLNEQAFSLLVYNSFFDPNAGANAGLGNLAGTALGNNAMQGLSAQFSNFLNKGAGDLVDINVAYNPGGINTNGNPLAASQEEIAVDLSRQFFDDRVVVNSVFDVPVGANPNRLAGNISVEYKITPDGRFRTRFFNRSNLENPYVDQLAPYSQGIGIFYRRDFNNIQDLFRRNKAVLRQEEKDAETGVDKAE